VAGAIDGGVVVSGAAAFDIEVEPIDVKSRVISSTLERQRRITEDGKIRRVECPHCMARVGEACRTPWWYETRFHVGRKKPAGVR
jgi:hypothetical protein